MPGWPEKVRTMQRNWIGRSEGAEVEFRVTAMANTAPITVFTTRVDTIFGATSIQLAPEHALVKEWVKTDAELGVGCGRDDCRAEGCARDGRHRQH